MKTAFGIILILSFSLFSTSLRCDYESINLVSKAIEPEIGGIIDSYNNIPVFYNGDVSNVVGRNTTLDGYNLGLKYQCVEYVKRYYYFVYDHKMTDSYGHAREFFDASLPDKMFNMKRGLYQFRNGSEYRPMPGDILIFDAHPMNPFGHIGIVTYSKGDKVEIIQQNVYQQSRSSYYVGKHGHKYYVLDAGVLGWLRKGG